MALACVLIAQPHIRTSSTKHSHQTKISSLKKVSIAYAIGALSSVVGAVGGFWMATGGPIPPLRLPQVLAAQCAGVLLATYIGGSVNFFAVADAVGLSSGGSSILGALAAADILWMAVYFSGILLASRSEKIQNVFPKEKQFPSVHDQESTQEKQYISGSVETPRSSVLQSATVIGAFAFFVSKLATCLGNKLPFPGASTGVLAVIASGAAWGLGTALPLQQYLQYTQVSGTLSRLLMNAFFAAVGASAKFSQIIGIGAPLFGLTGLVLLLHCVSLVVMTKLVNIVLKPSISLQEMLVASNANIGGPSTAATFASCIGETSLVMPATVVGTIGYAAATSLGVTFSRLACKKF